MHEINAIHCHLVYWSVYQYVVVEDDVIIGGGSLVPPNKRLESGYLYVGSPAKQARPLTEQELAFLKISADNYVSLKDEYLAEIANLS